MAISQSAMRLDSLQPNLLSILWKKQASLFPKEIEAAILKLKEEK